MEPVSSVWSQNWYHIVNNSHPMYISPQLRTFVLSELFQSPVRLDPRRLTQHYSLLQTVQRAGVKFVKAHRESTPH